MISIMPHADTYSPFITVEVFWIYLVTVPLFHFIHLELSVLIKFVLCHLVSDFH